MEGSPNGSLKTEVQKQSEFGGEMHLGNSFAPLPVAIRNHFNILEGLRALR